MKRISEALAAGCAGLPAYCIHAIIIKNVDDEYISDAENVDAEYIL